MEWEVERESGRIEADVNVLISGALFLVFDVLVRLWRIWEMCFDNELREV